MLLSLKTTPTIYCKTDILEVLEGDIFEFDQARSESHVHQEMLSMLGLVVPLQSGCQRPTLPHSNDVADEKITASKDPSNYFSLALDPWGILGPRPKGQPFFTTYNVQEDTDVISKSIKFSVDIWYKIVDVGHQERKC